MSMLANPLRVCLLLIALLLPWSTWAEEPREVDWLELIPESEIQRLMALPPIEHTGFFQPEQEMSFVTVPEMDGQLVRIPGYIVPLDSDADGRLTEFFLVPYFGACIHVPPPPPNQILFARLQAPIPMTDIYEAYWVEGRLRIETLHNEIAATAYSIDVRSVEVYR